MDQILQKLLLKIIVEMFQFMEQAKIMKYHLMGT